jgi:hypothetical protein
MPAGFFLFWGFSKKSGLALKKLALCGHRNIEKQKIAIVKGP